VNEIVALAVHDLNRREGRFEVNLAERQLPVTATTQRVIDEIYDLYNRRAQRLHISMKP
jgi:nucleoid-associated protein